MRKRKLRLRPLSMRFIKSDAFDRLCEVETRQAENDILEYARRHGCDAMGRPFEEVERDIMASRKARDERERARREQNKTEPSKRAGHPNGVLNDGPPSPQAFSGQEESASEPLREEETISESVLFDWPDDLPDTNTSF